MATTATIKLTNDQKKQIAKDLRVDLEKIPDEIGLVAISPEAGKHIGMPENMQSRFAPAMIIT